MNNDLNIDEWIFRYHEGDLKGKDLEEFLQMLAFDPEIRAKTELDGKITEFLRDRDLLEFRKMLDEVKTIGRRGFGLNCLLLAALLLVMIVLGGFWLYQNPFRSHHPMTNKGIADQGSMQQRITNRKGNRPLWNSPGFHLLPAGEKEKDKDLLALNFRPLTCMEGMVGVVTRAASFQLLVPGSSLSVSPGDTLRFRWKKDEEGELSFRVINNQGKLIASRDSIPGVSMDIHTTRWQEGLYYWKFIDRDHLVNVGKIIVRK